MNGPRGSWRSLLTFAGYAAVTATVLVAGAALITVDRGGRIPDEGRHLVLLIGATLLLLGAARLAQRALRRSPRHHR